MYIVIEKIKSGGHGHFDRTKVHKLEDKEKLKDFILMRDAKNLEIFEATPVEATVDVVIKKPTVTRNATPWKPEIPKSATCIHEWEEHNPFDNHYGHQVCKHCSAIK